MADYAKSHFNISQSDEDAWTAKLEPPPTRNASTSTTQYGRQVVNSVGFGDRDHTTEESEGTISPEHLSGMAPSPIPQERRMR